MTLRLSAATFPFSLMTIEIVVIGFGVVAGAIAVAAAIAFGIGGRDAAKSMIDDFASKRRNRA